MKDHETGPETLLQAIRYFADEDTALEYMARLRWPDGEQGCPHCGSVREHYFLTSRRIWKCKDCRKQFSIKVGTIFEDSPIKLSKWLPAVWMLANCKNGISSYELARALGVTQKTAWFMLHRIRLAMQTGSFDKMKGEVEADETYIGGLARNMHKDRRERVVKSGGRGPSGKTAVMGLLERHGPQGSRVRAKVIKSLDRYSLQGEVHRHVEYESTVHTDAFSGYKGLHHDFVHKVIDHAEAYARGSVHTNGMENFWSLVKRALHGTYVSVEPFHLFRYLDEQTYRFNNRKADDGGRFRKLLRDGLARRLTYAELTGKRGLQPA